MSAGDDGPGRREVAHRLFAAEFDDATVSYAESDEERAPKYVVTPTGARVNRLFAVGVLTEVESVNDDVLRARVVDPTGAFVSYAGQYQPDAAAFFERADPPAFVALTGKARTFEPDDGDRVYTSVRPESVAEVDADTRDRWTVSAAAATLRRVATMADALSLDERGEDLRATLEARDVDEALAAGIPIALDRYGTTVAYLDAVREVALDALEVVAGERDAVRALDTAPDDAGTTSLGTLPEAVRRTEPTDEGSDRPDPTGTEATVGETGADGAVDAAAAEADGSSGDVSESPDDGPAASGRVSAGDESAPSGTADTGATADTPSAGATGPDDGDGDSDDELGSFDDGDSDDELGSFDDGDGDDLYELDEEERREVEAEFDVGFESGAEVGDPGEADIDVPGPEDLPEGGEAAGATDEAAATDGAVADADATADIDLESAAVDAMSTLDEGDGAPHDEVVAAVVEEYGADPGAVADAIEDALMSGQCYEPSEDRLKAI